ncbi:hypothetical protein LDENG_00087190 [Lucifuga dentata]|nr:hypothetical protein LDENG_00087190 [Lucifuga dentata]
MLDSSLKVSNLQSLTLGFIVLSGLIYGLNLSYPEELKCTFKVFLHMLKELDQLSFHQKSRQ